MRVFSLIAILSLTTLISPVCEAHGGGGGGGGGGHAAGAWHGGAFNPYAINHHRGGYVNPYMGNNADITMPQYQPIGPSAAGGNVDPNLPRSAFVKTYYWPKKT